MEYRLLKGIKHPHDIKKLNHSELLQLAGEVRGKIIETTSNKGGHLAASLGVVELTIALYTLVDWDNDKVVWDTGHQAYPHKLLTGRYSEFDTIRQYGGISGFLKMSESEFDHFGAGHAGTALSAALGMAIAKKDLKESGKAIAIIGDTSIQSGMALEAINYAGHKKEDVLYILNDNNMSIGPAVGAYSNYLNTIRLGKTYLFAKDIVENRIDKIPGIGHLFSFLAKSFKDSIKYSSLFLTPSGRVFEDLGFTYIGPVDGHNIEEMRSVLTKVLKLKEPVLLHVITQKGKGYAPAEQSPTVYHGLGKFDRITGEIPPAPPQKNKTYTEVFGETIDKLADTDDKIVAITASMPDGTGLNNYSLNHPDRYHDVGIAEENAVTMAAGLAATGMKPFVAIYSTFLQRGFDQIVHDVALQHLPVRFCLDRGGIVGADGPTHHGTFDISYLTMIPGMTVLAPADENELIGMLKTMAKIDAPIAVRYPRGAGCADIPLALEDIEPIEIGKASVYEGDKDILIIAAGRMVHNAMQAKKILMDNNTNPTVINLRTIKPFDKEAILSHAYTAKIILTIEDGSIIGGIGMQIAAVLNSHNIIKPVINLGWPDKFIEHGTVAQLDEYYDLDPKSIANTITDSLKKIKNI